MVPRGKCFIYITYVTDLHINDFQQSYIEYMLFGVLTPAKGAGKMSLNTCKVIIKNNDRTAVSRGVLCTSDIELHISMLTCPR
jgi:hypothetical protein